MTEIALSTDKRFFAGESSAAAPRRVLIISPDRVGKQMAGPAIRCWELARALSPEFDVTLATPQPDLFPSTQFRVVCYSLVDQGGVAQLVDVADVVIVTSYLVQAFPFLGTIDKPIVADIYAPFLLENIEQNSGLPASEQMTAYAYSRDVLGGLLSVGDFFLCASEKQRDFYLGMLAARGRVNPLTADQDKTMRRLIDVVPFGMQADAPEHTRSVLKGVTPGINADDKLLLWGGGIWDWFDPLTLLKAMVEIGKTRQDVKLFFMGANHPHPEIVPRGKMARRTVEMAKELGLYDRTVFFGQWSGYEDRQNYLLEGDLGVSLHHDNLETRFSFRTRMLDYIWAGLPIVTSKGDSFGDLIQQYELGKVVDCGDVAGVADAILTVLDGEETREVYRARATQVIQQFVWNHAAEPLRRFCRQPALAPDRARAIAQDRAKPEAAVSDEPKVELAPAALPVPTLPWYRLLGKAWRVLSASGPRRLWWEARMYFRWRFGR